MKVYLVSFISLLVLVVVMLQWNGLNSSYLNGLSDKVSTDHWNTLLLEKGSTHRNFLLSQNETVKATMGQIIWNIEQQRGLLRFMNLVRLKENYRYILWGFDLHRKQSEPNILQRFNSNKSSEGFLYLSFNMAGDQPYKFLVTIENNNDSVTKPTLAKSVFMAQP